MFVSARYCLLLTGLLVCATFSPLQAQSIPIGVAKIDITPDYPVRLTGYGNRKTESAGVVQPLWAKAIVFGGDDAEGPAIWLTVENCGLTPAIRNEVVSKLTKSANVKSERLVISVTHTHTAPALKDWAPYLFGADVPPDHRQHIERYTHELTEKLVQVATLAMADRRPAKLKYAVGKATFASNRRVLKEGKWTGFGVQSDGPVDYSLPLLAAFDEQGKLFACVANYACHCTTLGGNFNQICGDWAGYAQAAIEADHPGTVALITIGCGADANPEPRKDDLAICERHGREIGDEVKRLLKSEMRLVAGPLRCKLTSIELPFETPRSKQEWSELAKGSDVTGYYAQKYLARLEAGEKLPTDLSNYPVGCWSFGNDLAMVFLGGEVVVDYAIRLREELDSDRLWITAYSNDVPCYIPSRRILREGGYEADRSMALYGRPNRFAPEVEDLVIDAVQKVVPHEFYSPQKQVDFPPPKSPEQALASIKVLDGWKVDLVAAEPLVEDPVAFDWGPDGKLWVAEMRDYPNGVEWDKPGDPLGVPGGRIKILHDDDRDGRYDRFSIFLDGVPFPNGVKAWRNGVLVTAAPDIFYAEDSDQDGRADRREILFKGFAEGNQQHRANGLRWGLDNWLYVANGDSGGKIKSIKKGSEVAISGRDVRIRPDTGEIETQSGQTQFGRCNNDWNDWFGGNNSNPLWHYVLDDQYLKRNPRFAGAGVRRDVPEVPGAAPVFPTSRTLARFNDFHTANRFTSACSPEIYRDDRFLAQLGKNQEHVFICEPVHNLVHHEVMTPAGVSFTSRRSDQERESEFFASSDNWCRPVMVRTGPDGAFWIADMYRQVIEHPEWIPMTSQRKLELRAGTDRGRIYRISAASEKERRPVPRLDQLDTASLVRNFEHPNGWVRDTAQQVILWQQDAAAAPLLEELAVTSSNPLARLHALCTLQGLEKLRPKLLQRFLNDPHPGVRRHAVRLSEPFFESSEELVVAVEKLVSDPNDMVRLQVAYSLGASKKPTSGRALAKIAAASAKNEYLVAAVFSSLHQHNVDSFATALMTSDRPDSALVSRVFGFASALKDKTGAVRIATTILHNVESLPVINQIQTATELLAALREQNANAQSFLSEDAIARFKSLAVQARKVAADETATSEDRLIAVRHLGAQLERVESDADLLASLFSPRQSTEVQSAAMAALIARFPDKLMEKSLPNWKSYSPTLRAQILDAVLARPNSTMQFLDAVERGEIIAAHVDARRRQHLLTHIDGPIRTKATKIFGAVSQSSRAQVVEQLLPASTNPGDIARGKATFVKRCSVCHKLDGTGQNVGPDLMALTDKSPRSLLIAMLDPNKAVEDKFLDYVAVTTDGRQFTGMIVNETSNSVTLVGQEAKQATLARGDVELLQSTGRSLMPEGLEKDMSAQDFADVIAYVRSLSAPPKSFPGNQPELAHVRDDGSIRLLAINAKIYGPTLVLEDKYRNLGYWQSADDHAVWMMNVPKAGRYQVRLDYACDDSAAGDRYVIAVGDQSVGGVVSGTGSWDRYRGAVAGRIDLPLGYAELVIRSEGPIRSALMDLRQIILEPE